MQIESVLTFILIICAFIFVRKIYNKSIELVDHNFFIYLVAFISSLFLWTINRDLVALTATTNPVNIANALTLIQLTIIGISLFVVQVKYPVAKYIGSMLVIGVILRLLFVEMWMMSLAPRVITFLFIGLLFVGSSFFEKKYILKK
jgi:hypothetical protein